MNLQLAHAVAAVPSATIVPPDTVRQISCKGCLPSEGSKRLHWSLEAFEKNVYQCERVTFCTSEKCGGTFARQPTASHWQLDRWPPCVQEQTNMLRRITRTIKPNPC